MKTVYNWNYNFWLYTSLYSRGLETDGANITYYRPQTKFAKVMFLQVPVCPHGGGACMVLFGGHAWFYLGGVHGFIRGGHAWFYLGGHVWFFQFFRYNEIRSRSGRYASYWNAFLLIQNLTEC